METGNVNLFKLKEHGPMDDITYEMTSQVFMPVVVIHSVKDAVSIVIFIMDIKNPIIVIILIIDMIPIMTQNMSLLQPR